MSQRKSEGTFHQTHTWISGLAICAAVISRDSLDQVLQGLFIAGLVPFVRHCNNSAMLAAIVEAVFTDNAPRPHSVPPCRWIEVQGTRRKEL